MFKNLILIKIFNLNFLLFYYSIANIQLILYKIMKVAFLAYRSHYNLLLYIYYYNLYH